MKTEPLIEGGYMTTGRGPLRPIIVVESTPRESRESWIELAARQQRQQWEKEHPTYPTSTTDQIN